MDEVVRFLIFLDKCFHAWNLILKNTSKDSFINLRLNRFWQRPTFHLCLKLHILYLQWETFSVHFLRCANWALKVEFSSEFYFPEYIWSRRLIPGLCLEVASSLSVQRGLCWPWAQSSISWDMFVKRKCNSLQLRHLDISWCKQFPGYFKNSWYKFATNFFIIYLNCRNNISYIAFLFCFMSLFMFD